MNVCVNYYYYFNDVLFPWQIYQRLSEEASNGAEETQDRCITFLRKYKTYLSKIYNAHAEDIEKASSISCRLKQTDPSIISEAKIVEDRLKNEMENVSESSAV